MAGDVPPSEVADAERELDSARSELLRRPGVTGVDIGLRRGGEAGGVAVRVYVERKLPPEAVPKHELLPERLGRFPVEVVEASFGPERN